MADLTTTLIHHPYEPPAGFAAPQPGVFKASTVIFPNVAAMRDFEWKDKTAYTYGLHGTPTTYTLEERLCTSRGALQCLLLPSGLAAIANVALSLLRTGDEVLIPDNAYGPNKVLAEGELKSWGITHRYYDPMSPQDLADKISPQTRWSGWKPRVLSPWSFRICAKWCAFAGNMGCGLRWTTLGAQAWPLPHLT